MKALGIALALLALATPAFSQKAKVQETRMVKADSIQVPDSIQKAVAAADRPDRDKARDADRKPGQVLAFYGLKPGMTVVELMAGDGYYVEILSHAVGEKGKVIAHNSPYVMNRYARKPLEQRLADDRLPNVEVVESEVDALPFKENSLDLVILNRFYHDLYWQSHPDGSKIDNIEMNRQVLKALKPGGVYAIVDHHAEKGSGARDVKTLHRVDAEMVKKEILEAGFVLDAETDVLANPEDTHDWGVFSDQSARRDKTDRFVWRFRKAEG